MKEEKLVGFILGWIFCAGLHTQPRGRGSRHECGPDLLPAGFWCQPQLDLPFLVQRWGSQVSYYAIKVCLVAEWRVRNLVINSLVYRQGVVFRKWEPIVMAVMSVNVMKLKSLCIWTSELWCYTISLEFVKLFPKKQKRFALLQCH